MLPFFTGITFFPGSEARKPDNPTTTFWVSLGDPECLLVIYTSIDPRNVPILYVALNRGAPTCSPSTLLREVFEGSRYEGTGRGEIGNRQEGERWETACCRCRRRSVDVRSTKGEFF